MRPVLCNVKCPATTAVSFPCNHAPRGHAGLTSRACGGLDRERVCLIVESWDVTIWRGVIRHIGLGSGRPKSSSKSSLLNSTDKKSPIDRGTHCNFFGPGKVGTLDDGHNSPGPDVPSSGTILNFRPNTLVTIKGDGDPPPRCEVDACGWASARCIVS